MTTKNGQWPADRVERRNVAELVPYARNARLHSDEQVAQIAQSITTWGWTIPVLVDEDGMVIAGHGRLLAAEGLGITEVPTMVAHGWTENQKRAYIIADNKLALNADWDSELLGLELSDLLSGGVDMPVIGFDVDDLAALGVGVEAQEYPELSDGGRSDYENITFTVLRGQGDIVRRALTAARDAGPFTGRNENGNGNAITRVCRGYLKNGKG